MDSSFKQIKLRQRTIGVRDVFKQNKKQSNIKIHYNGVASSDILNFAISPDFNLNLFALEDITGSITILGKFGNDVLQTFYEILAGFDVFELSLRRINVIGDKILQIQIIEYNNEQSVIDDYIKKLEMFGLIKN